MLIDDTERTNWTAAGTITGGTPTTGGDLSVAGKRVTVDLAGTKAVTIRHIQVSSMLRSGVVALPALTNVSQNRFTALRQFEVWACNAEKDNCSTSAGFDARVHEPRRRLPGRSAAASGSAHDPARVRHPEHRRPRTCASSQ